LFRAKKWQNFCQKKNVFFLFLTNYTHTSICIAAHFQSILFLNFIIISVCIICPETGQHIHGSLIFCPVGKFLLSFAKIYWVFQKCTEDLYLSEFCVWSVQMKKLVKSSSLILLHVKRFKIREAFKAMISWSWDQFLNRTTARWAVLDKIMFWYEYRKRLKI